MYYYRLYSYVHLRFCGEGLIELEKLKLRQMRKGGNFAFQRIVTKPAAACCRFHETAPFAENGVTVVKRGAVLTVYANIITVFAFMMHTNLHFDELQLHKYKSFFEFFQVDFRFFIKFTAKKAKMTAQSKGESVGSSFS